jgi:NTP pyrophosphatase (non-canonical NTP hydrolase)
VPIEIADLVIRVADFCRANGIDLAAAVRYKMAYNETRPHRHGGKTC